ncbi:MAG TPA: thymidine phosphorylase [Candidatus Nanoarchaeia archaeon]|nr:thymidine phosphorylase [Candidatus Nanoarchaeia archaeon]
MDLKVKILKWKAGIPVAMIREETAIKIGVRANDRISIKTQGEKEFTTILDTIGGNFIHKDQIAISSEITHILNLRKAQKVEIKLAPRADSLDFIKKKLNNNALSKKEIKKIIEDVMNNSLSDPEIALFISGMYKNGMSFKETIYLIDSILKSGGRLKLNKKMIVDKHSIGGIAGNRTTPLVVSICAATGLTCPKTSSRAITTAAGTADVIEAIAQVEFSLKDLKKIIQKTNACMVWGGSLGMVPADDKIIQIEKALKIDPEAQLLASIMSKKLAMGSNYILIDIPYGKSAKVSKSQAEHLKKKFLALAKYFKKKLEVVITDGSQPIGNGIGPVLELIDIIKILEPNETGPQDLEKKALFLSARIFEMCGKAKKGKGIQLAKEILYSGKAFDKFKEIIKAQKGSITHLIPGEFKKTILSPKAGIIREIDNKKINSLARVAGSPGDKRAGLYLHVHKNFKVSKGDKLITLYAESNSRLYEAIKYFLKIKPITISQHN